VFILVEEMGEWKKERNRPFVSSYGERPGPARPIYNSVNILDAFFFFRKRGGHGRKPVMMPRNRFRELLRCIYVNAIDPRL